MCIKKMLLGAVAVSVVSVGLASCGGKKTAAAPAAQPQVGQPNARGIERQEEPCEAMALEPGSPPRASGNAISQNEQHGTRSAMLSARAELARIVESAVSGMDRGFAEEHTSGQDGSAYVGKNTSIEQGLFDQVLNNSRMICKKVYDRPDGRMHIYIAVELGQHQKAEIFKTLKDNEKLAIDYAEHRFNEDFQKQLDKLRESRR